MAHSNGFTSLSTKCTYKFELREKAINVSEKYGGNLIKKNHLNVLVKRSDSEQKGKNTFQMVSKQKVILN